MEFLEHSGELDNIWTASSNGDLARVKQLIESGEVDINDRDEYGYSALQAAVSYGHMNLLEYLLTNPSINVRLKDLDGDEPIHACEDPRVFEILVEHGADPTATNYAGEDLFAKCIEDENEEMVNYLISIGLGQALEGRLRFQDAEDTIEEGDENEDEDEHDHADLEEGGGEAMDHSDVAGEEKQE